MPTLAQFNGLKICVYFGEHQPPHVHVYAEGHQYRIAIANLEPIMEGPRQVPAKVLKLFLEWAKPRQEYLRAAWDACQQGFNPPAAD